MPHSCATELRYSLGYGHHVYYLHSRSIVVRVVEDARRHRGVATVNAIALDYDGAAGVLQNRAGQGVFICQATNVGGRNVHAFPPDDVLW